MNIYKEIMKYMNQQRYEDALEEIQFYFSMEECGISATILIQYVTCLYSLGYFEEAKKQLDLIEKIYSNIPQYWLLEARILSNDIEKAKEKMKEDNLSLLELSKIGKAFYKVGYYEEADSCFQKIWEETENDYLRGTATHFRKQILDYRLKNQFIKMDYRYFKIHNKLSEGDIFYTKIEHDVPKEERRYCRPMMVWKVEGEKVYAFPLTKKTTRKDGRLKGYLICCDKYRNFDGNRSLKYDMVKVQEKDIGRVIERIDRHDYKELLRSVYSTIHRIGTPDVYEAGEKFLKEYKFSLYPESIVDTFDEERNKKYYYLKTVDETKINGYGYELLLNEHVFLIKDGILKQIPEEETIISASQVSYHLKENLNCQIAQKQKIKTKRGPHEN